MTRSEAGMRLVLTGAMMMAGSAAALAARVPPPGGTLFTPQSSLELPQDRGRRAHTDIELFIPSGALPMSGTASTPGGYFETPASLACVYRQVKASPGCNPTVATAVANAGGGAIAVVDAYDDPTAASDLGSYSSEFGLPAPSAKTFAVVYATPGGSTQTTTPPPQDASGDWESEESLDIEMAHAMAPKAKIYLVEANSNNSNDLLPAVTLASTLVAAAGGGEVSMSWGFGDFAGESGYDSYFSTSGVVYFASAGDSAGLNYPSTSPYVVSAGGTTLDRDPNTGDFEKESAWPSTGGGSTPNEPRPSWQDAIESIVGSGRGTPDLGFDADGRTGVWMYDSNPINGVSGPWWITSGTSVAAPGLAGLINAAGRNYGSTTAELTAVYGNLGNADDFNDVAAANCGPYAGYLSAKGWDFCTGVGSVKGKSGK